MPQAIVTRYHGPTDWRPARYSAASDAGRRFFSASKCEAFAADRPGFGGYVQAVHGAALRLYLETLPHRGAWGGDWIGGSMPGGGAMCWVPSDGPKESF